MGWHSTLQRRLKIEAYRTRKSSTPSLRCVSQRATRGWLWQKTRTDHGARRGTPSELRWNTDLRRRKRSTCRRTGYCFGADARCHDLWAGHRGGEEGLRVCYVSTRSGADTLSAPILYREPGFKPKPW